MSGRVRVRRLSGLQNQVLGLYRDCLRAAKQKASPESQRAARDFASARFREHAELKRTDFQRIEFLLRQGKKQLAMYGAPDVEGFAVATVTRPTRS